MADLPAGYSSKILSGLAQLIDDEGIAVYDPDGYPPGHEGFAVTFQTMPEYPVECICLAWYDAEDRTDVNLTATYVQARVRSVNPLAALDVTDALRDLFHRKTHFDLDGIRISNMRRMSNAYLGVNANEQHETTSNYRLVGSRAMLPVVPAT